MILKKLFAKINTNKPNFVIRNIEAKKKMQRNTVFKRKVDAANKEFEGYTKCT